MPHTLTWTPGQHINGYQLIRLLGEGGSGTVFEALQVSTQQMVAFKLLRQNADTDPARLQRLADRFERETQLCAQLHHPHIVRLLDKGTTDSGQMYAVFEFVPGETLQAHVQREGALSALATGDLLGQVLDALACAHAQGIAHRDLKPHNIMLTTTGTRTHVKVLDFGIATLVADWQKPDYRQVTLTQETMCSPSYSAPEQLRGEPPTLKSDLYAWGLLFLECLTGSPAIHGETMAEVFHQQLGAWEVPIPPALVGHPLADFLRRVLRKNPVERAENAAALYDDFKRINLANIVGTITAQRTAMGEAGSTTTASMLALTQDCTVGWPHRAPVRQQMTVLCCSLFIMASPGSEMGLEALEALHRDQLSLCIDTATRYGAHVAASMGNSVMFYFGHPHWSDDDARRGARTALELVSQVRRRSVLLARQHGVALDVQMGLHTGMVLARANEVPTGITPHIAQQLERLAEPGCICVSAPARQLLEPFVEFDVHAYSMRSSTGETLTYFALAGERQTEALSFLHRHTSGHQLIGRQTQVDTLWLAWNAAAAGHASMAYLQGDAGIGKSRLVYELRQRVHQAGGRTLEARCLPEHHNNALYPILGIIQNHWQLHDASTNPEGALAKLAAALAQAQVPLEHALPILCTWLGWPVDTGYPPLQLSPERQKQVLLQTLQQLLQSIARQQPTLVVIEDMHWADQTSRAWLQHLASQLDSTLGNDALMVLLTSRPDAQALQTWPAPVQHVALERLTATESAQLITNLLAGKTMDASSMQRLCERTDGIPLFVEEMVRMLLEQRLLVEHQGVYSMPAHHQTATIPITLRDLLGARLARMGSARETAQLAATIGREFEHALLVHVALADEAKIQSDLEQLMQAELIYRQHRVDGDSYVFRHALIRDAAYDTLPQQAREHTHARIAQHIEAGPADKIDQALPQLAQHFAGAAQFEPAVRYGTRAALTSLNRALHDDAITLAQTAQTWTQQLPGADQRPASVAINRVMTHALMSKYGWADARVRDSAEQALQLIENIDDPAETVPTLWAMAFYHHVASHRASVRAVADQLLQLSGRSNDQGLNIASHTVRGMGHWIDGEYPSAKRSFETVLAHYDPAAHAHHGAMFGLDSRVWAMAGLANVRWFMETEDEPVLELARAAVERGRQLNHIPSLGVAMMYLTFLHYYSNDREGARTACVQLLDLSLQYGLPAVEGYASIAHSWAVGDLAAADQVVQGLRGMGCMLGLTYATSLAAQIAFEQGAYEDAFQRVEQSLILSETQHEYYYRPELLRQRALYRTRTPWADTTLSRDDVMHAMALAEAGGMGRCIKHCKEDLQGWLSTTDTHTPPHTDAAHAVGATDAAHARAALPT